MPSEKRDQQHPRGMGYTLALCLRNLATKNLKCVAATVGWMTKQLDVVLVGCSFSSMAAILENRMATQAGQKMVHLETVVTQAGQTMAHLEISQTAANQTSGLALV